MAKGNMLLGQARGKVGDIVFSRNNGQQVIRARSAQVKNSKTTAQTLQRIVMNTVAQAYSFMLPICDHSFEGVKVGQDTMSTFMKRNLNLLRRRITIAREQSGSLEGIFSFTPVGSKTFALNSYIMSEGTLPRISVTSLVTQGGANQGAQIAIAGARQEMTYADFISAFGLRKGDQITFVQVSQGADGNFLFNYARVILDPMDAEGVPMALDTQMIEDNAVLNPCDRNEGMFTTLAVDNGVLTFHLGGGTPVSACVIVSRQDTTGQWLRSTSTLAIPSNLLEFNQTSLLDAIDLYYSGGIDFESDWYLNNSISSAGNSTSPSSSSPRVTSLYVGGLTCLGVDTTQTITPSSAAPIRVSIQNFSATANNKIIGTSRELNVDDMYNSQGGDIVVACTSSSVSTSIDLSAEGSYRFYFVSGGIVRKKHGLVVVAAAAGASVTAASFNGINLLTNQTITSISQGTSGTLAATVANASELTSPKLLLKNTNTQPSVGGSIASPEYSVDVVNGSASDNVAFNNQGMYYLVLADNATVVQVVSAISISSGVPDDNPGDAGNGD